MDLKYLDHLPAEFEQDAVRLYVEAFKEKLMPIFGEVKRAINILSRKIEPDRCLTVLCDQNLAGILGIRTIKGGFVNIKVKALISEYGLADGLYRFIGLVLLHHQIKTDEWYVDGIAVSEKMRGKGLGTGLLNYLESLAREKRISKLSLDVTNSNEKARALYSRLGYVAIDRNSLWPFNYFYDFPFQSAITMEKSLL